MGDGHRGLQSRAEHLGTGAAFQVRMAGPHCKEGTEASEPHTRPQHGPSHDPVTLGKLLGRLSLLDLRLS